MSPLRPTSPEGIIMTDETNGSDDVEEVTKQVASDLQDLEIGDGADMIVRHPISDKPLVDEDGNPWTIRLESSYSDQYERAMHKVQNRRLKKAGRGGRIRIQAEDLEEGTLECLLAVTISWKGIASGGVVLECTPKNVREQYAKHTWLREQVVDFTEDQANFLPPVSKRLSST